jgi:hypothetical protein
MGRLPIKNRFGYIINLPYFCILNQLNMNTEPKPYTEPKWVTTVAILILVGIALYCLDSFVDFRDHFFH